VHTYAVYEQLVIINLRKSGRKKKGQAKLQAHYYYYYCISPLWILAPKNCTLKHPPPPHLDTLGHVFIKKKKF